MVFRINMEENKKSSYRSIFKATSLFGGLQVYQILLGIIRSKLIAILLGPEGMGISGLLQSGRDLVKECTSLGLSRSAVRDVAEANGTGDTARIARTVTVLRKLVWYTGLLGVLAVILFSPILSKSGFGDYSYVIAFCLLSVTLLFSQLSEGQTALLQGLRKYNYLVKATAIGNTLGLFFTIPLYYLYGTSGIVPALIITSIISLVLSYYYSRKIQIPDVHISTKEVLKEGKGMMSLGIIMSLNGMLVLGCAYVIRAFISNVGGLDQVGLYNAGFAIVNTYVGMIFSAMTSDYFPRLSSVNKDNEKCRVLINQQAEISILLLAPVVSIFIAFTPLALFVLYSDKFVSANGFVLWALYGMLFKAIGWCISFIFLAKGDKMTFIKNEIFANVSNVLLCVIGYKMNGLTGLGIGYMTHFVLYVTLLFYIAHKKYQYFFSKEILKIISVQVPLLTIEVVLTYLLDGAPFYICSSIVILISLVYSFIELDKRMDIRKYFKR